MKFLRTKAFLKQYVKLPASIQKKFDRQLISLATKSIRHPGLRAKKMAGFKNIWEARVDIHHRFTFQIQNGTVILRKIGTHQIYQKP